MKNARLDIEIYRREEKSISYRTKSKEKVKFYILNMNSNGSFAHCSLLNGIYLVLTLSVLLFTFNITDEYLYVVECAAGRLNFHAEC